MPAPQLDLRLDLLIRTQNPDGGWGYFMGKESWTEPTAYAIIALAGTHPERAKRALQALEQRQHSSGAWSANAHLAEPHWSTALVLLAQQALGTKGPGYRRGIDWLLQFEGVDGSFLSRFMNRIGREQIVEQDYAVHGWPWRDGNSSWVEPTALSLLCLKRDGTPAARQRILDGEKMLIDRRCEDHGWNYGNRRVYGVPMESFPETTGLALLGLQGRQGLEKSLDRARKSLAAPAHGVARAWLHLGLAGHGSVDSLELEDKLTPGAEIAVAALELIAARPESSRHLLLEGKWPTS